MTMELPQEQAIIAAKLLHDKLGIPASARASLGVYNDKEDIDVLVSQLKNVKRYFKFK